MGNKKTGPAWLDLNGRFSPGPGLNLTGFSYI